MKTSELSFLYNRGNLTPTGNLQYDLDEKLPGETLRNNDIYQSVSELVAGKNASLTPTTTPPTAKDKPTSTVDKYTMSESYFVDISNDTVIEKGERVGQNYIKNFISKAYNKKTVNPYLSLLEDSEIKESTGALHLTYNDFIYLRDIGVYPINRLIILRRFSSAPISPDLTTGGYNQKTHSDGGVTNKNPLGKPLSTVIGWVKNDDDIFNMSFNEIWKTQDKWVHDLVREIINDQFGVDIGNIFPMPGWGQSMMFSFLNKLGWTDYNGQNLPIGDANLLRTGITRETDTTGLSSNISFKLETTYELKYVNDMDPTLVFHQIISNIMTMGTENIKFLFKGGSNMSQLMSFISNPNLSSLITMVSDLVNQIITEVKSQLSILTQKMKGSKDEANFNKEVSKIKEKNLSDQEIVDKANAKKGDNTANPAQKEELYYYDGGAKSINEQEHSKALIQSTSLYEKKRDADATEQAKQHTQKTSKLDKILNFKSSLATSSTVIDMVVGFVNSILASTVARYKWPLRGAIAQSTGMNLTPWHITIGNPLAPIISMNYIKVDSVELKLSGDLMYNDLPRFINVTISVSNARPLGKQEMLKFFGVKFKREYQSGNMYFTGTEDAVFNTEELLNQQSTARLQKTAKK